MKIKIAQFLSVIGHPLLLFPFLILFFNLREEQVLFSNTLAMVLGLFFFILIAWVYIGKRRGKYTDLDVSNKKQRKSLYVFTIPVMVLTLFFLIYTNQPKYIVTSFALATLLLLVSFGINFYIKVSMHVAINMYLALAISKVSLELGIVLALFTVVVLWSRLVLERHTPKEVVLGLVVGSLFGTSLLLIS
ncbi:hypothetical protein M4I21_01920 [Cellulophaga sp. 20_2_10]|uniref:hypothetical protein n=1 Tax=Cellulophaga sp. 20_2_10 TaxID=2942476 RepID=UPI00201A2F97|nr:hypothetical protein [Cellulophaga sp. 20_2_10]MCL5244546.1 hypothetical protein [Cellulophaga sp. 20_2_10]